jgi:hypothetical protein
MWQRGCDNTAPPDFYVQHWQPLLPQHENAGLRFTRWMLRLRLARSAQGLYGEDTVTKDDIIRMAREAGMHDPMIFIYAYERFANLVAAAEREACAKLCEQIAMQQDYDVRDECAAAIRTRGNT